MFTRCKHFVPKLFRIYDNAKLSYQHTLVHVVTFRLSDVILNSIISIVIINSDLNYLRFRITKLP